MWTVKCIQPDRVGGAFATRENPKPTSLAGAATPRMQIPPVENNLSTGPSPMRTLPRQGITCPTYCQLIFRGPSGCRLCRTSIKHRIERSTGATERGGGENELAAKLVTTTQNNVEELLNQAASRTLDTAAYSDVASAAWESTACHIEIEILA